MTAMTAKKEKGLGRGEICKYFLRIQQRQKLWGGGGGGGEGGRKG